MIFKGVRMSTVSVCIPTYNRKDYLKETLESVFAQSYGDYEVVVVDDGSSDGTREMIESMEKPIRYLWQPNQGDAQARNRLIEEARGKYITFLDSDDLLFPDSVQRLFSAIERNGKEACSYGPYIRIDKNGKTLDAQREELPSGNITVALFQRIWVHSCGSMFPKKALIDIGKFDASFPVCSDYCAWLKLSLRYPFIALQSPTFKRRRHGGNLSSVTSSKIAAELRVLRNFYEKEGGKNVVPLRIARKRFAKENHRAGKAAWEEGNRTAARAYFEASLKEDRKSVV